MFESFFLAQDNWWQPTRKYLGIRKNKHLMQRRENKERLENKHQKTLKMLGKIVPKRETTFKNNSVPKKEGKMKGKGL